MKIIVLYEELAWYFVNCLNVLAQKYNCTIFVFCKKVNADAPFDFKYIHPNISIMDRNGFSEKQLLKKTSEIAADVIFICGWNYKPYLHLVKKGISQNFILGLDNQWNKTLRQVAGSIYFRLNLKRYIKNVFVPGHPQYKFARQIGFSEQHISKGAYCCDYSFFNNLFKINRTHKATTFPKRFVFVGRYASEKGIEDLWQAFSEIQKETNSDWELWCVGAGKISPVKNSSIKHFGFIQPDELSNVIKNTGVFVLPSTFEPWGVVVHEFAAAGFPLICSNKVGAAELFLKEGQNGFIFPAGNREALKACLLKFIKMDAEMLNAMSVCSSQISASITPEIWTDNFIKLSQNAN